jgi:hypothetical protein
MKQASKISAQAAMEYLILLGVMVVIALTAFRTLVPGAQSETNQAFTSASANIIGPNAELKTSVGSPWI